MLSAGWLLSLQGLQNLLANATGNAAPPIIIGLFAGDAYTTSYLIASAFIVSGIATILTVIRFRIPGAHRGYVCIKQGPHAEHHHAKYLYLQYIWPARHCVSCCARYAHNVFERSDAI